MNNLKSYTEYAVTTPTTDFVIGFDFNYGTDAVNVTVDNVPASEAGYTVIYLNSTTMRLNPAVPSGVVRLQRETDIDAPDNQFTAGAKFITSNMDENFTQIRRSQQEVRDGFEKLSEDTYEIIDTLQVVGQAAQDAADAAEQAAQTANDAAAQVNDKVAKSATLPTYLTVADGVNPVTGVSDGAYFNVSSEDDDTIAIEYQNVGGSAVATGKSYLSASGVELQEKSAATIKDVSGLTQQEVNDGLGSISELISIANPVNGSRQFVKGSQGGWFEYNASKSSINDGGTIFNGWVRIHYLNKLSKLSWFGATPNDLASAAANEAKFISAIKMGDVVVDGYYYIACNENNSISNSFSLLSDSANSKIEITKIKDGWIKVGSIDYIRLQGVKFAADLTFSGGLISIETPTVLINEVEISGCKFDIGCRIFNAVFSKTDDPTVTPYGINRTKIVDNEINHSRTWFSTMNMPHEVIEIKRNRGRNISNICINISNDLTHTYAAKLVMLMKRAEVEFNTVINDDDFFPASVGTYMTFFLYEGSYCLYRNNWVEGLKSNLITVIYDLYMNGGKLDYFDNTWKNNVCIAPTKTGNELMKSKQALVSHYHRNTFIVEKEFLQRHGGDVAGAGWVTLWTKTQGDDTSEVEIIGNKIDVYELLGMSTAARSKNVTIRGNTFKAEKCASVFFNYPLLPTGMTDMTKAIIDIADNKFFIKDLGGEIIRDGSSYKGFELTRTTTSTPTPLSFYREISIQDNEINADTISGLIFGMGDKLVAKNIKVKGNKYNIYSQNVDSSFRGFSSTYITPIDRFECFDNEIVMHDGTLALNTVLDAKLPANAPSVFKNNFKGIFSNFITYIKSPTDNNLQVIVRLSVKTAQGKQSGSYKVTLTPTGIIYTDSADTEQTVPYNTSGTTYVNPKLTLLDPLDTLLAGVRLGIGVAGATGGSVMIDYRFTGSVNNVTPVDYDVDVETFVI